MIGLDNINKLSIDSFGRISGVFLLNKPCNRTSHDLVNMVRKTLNFRKVGHAGALDPFASGLMIILVGKSTKLSNSFLNLNKTYKFEVLIGLTSDTLDIEGDITEIKDIKSIDRNMFKVVVQSFKGKYLQQVPVYSSIKIKGRRLRELARKYPNFIIQAEGNCSYVIFDKNGESYKVKIPKREVEIYSIRLNDITKVQSRDLKLLNIKSKTNYKDIYNLNITANVSKGTYIRQLASDIGNKLGSYPAMLYSLTRTQIGKYSLGQTLTLKELKNIKTNLMAE